MRAQIATEFMYMLGVVILVGIIFTVLAGDQFATLQRQEFLEIATDTARVARQEVFLAAEVEDGYRRSFSLPTSIQEKPYNITAQESAPLVPGGETSHVVIVSDGPSGITYSIPRVVGDFQKGKNTIRKDGGVIYLNS